MLPPLNHPPSVAMILFGFAFFFYCLRQKS